MKLAGGVVSKNAVGNDRMDVWVKMSQLAVLLLIQICISQFRNARVFCLQPGHNNDSFADPSVRTVLSRGIQWAAGRL